jgi:ribose transport system permease protein
MNILPEQVVTAETRSARARRFILKNPILLFILNNGIIVVLLIEFLFFSFTLGTRFYRLDTLRLILLNASMIGVMMPFYTASQIGGRIDLGSVQVGALGAVVAGLFFTVFGLPLIVSILLAVVAAVLIGALYSWVVLRIGAPSVIASLAVGSFSQGIARMITQTWGSTYFQIRFITPQLKDWIDQGPLNIPLTIWVMLLLYIIYDIMLRHTKLGAHIYAVGGNPMVARLAGIRVAGVTIFCLMGLTIGTVVASIFLCARLTYVGDTGNFSAASASAAGALAVPITLIATTISGIQLKGGNGSLWKTMLGIIFFSGLTIGMGLLSAPAQYRVMAYGGAVVIAVILDSIRTHLRID